MLSTLQRETKTSIFVRVSTDSTQTVLTPLCENLKLGCSTVSRTLGKTQLLAQPSVGALWFTERRKAVGLFHREQESSFCWLARTR
jgi:hypothetical protein